MLIFLLPTLVRGYEKRTKGTRESPLFAEVYGTLLARVGEELNKCNYARCLVCVCVCVCVCVLAKYPNQPNLNR